MKKILLMLFVFSLTLSSDLLSNDYSKIEFTNTKGVVFQSFDNGRTWENDNNSIIEFTNTKGLVFRSFDNGQTWEKLINSKIKFTNTKGTEFRSFDNGQTWEKVNKEALAVILNIELINSQGIIYNSHDGGTTWTRVNTDSQMEILSKDDNISVGIFPNPSTSILKVSVNLKNEELYSICITDLLGNQKFNKKELLRKGDNIVDIDVSSFISGTYVVSIIGLTKCSANFVKE